MTTHYRPCLAVAINRFWTVASSRLKSPFNVPNEGRIATPLGIFAGQCFDLTDHSFDDVSAGTSKIFPSYETLGFLA